MQDHPVLGIVLFVIGAALVGIACYGSIVSPTELFGSFVGTPSDEMTPSLVLGLIAAFNGVLFVFLGRNKLGV